MTKIKKLGKSQYPPSHSPSDFKAFGPVATKDGEFEGTKLADLACFKQDKIDTNKFYHAAVVQSKLTSEWFVFFSWGRVGGSQDFQFLPCSSEQEAQQEYEKQLHKKNDKRGIWEDHPTLGRILRAKPKKDVYLVSAKVNRSVSLPDAKNIGSQPPEKIKRKSSIIFDSEADKLLQDLNAGTIDYTRTSIVGGDIPSKEAINQAKQILDLATSINNGLKTEKQRLENKELYEISQLLYSKIPKKKSRYDEKEDWLLLPNNIVLWEDEIKAYESALEGADNTIENIQYSFTLLTLPFNSEKGKFVIDLFEKSTANKHSNFGKLKIRNIWEVERKSDSEKMKKYQLSLGKVKNDDKWVQWHPKPKNRPDVEDIDLYYNTFTTTLYHGSRSCNILSILDKSFLLPRRLSGVTKTGSLYGSGTYFASDRLKSMNYTSYSRGLYSHGSGGIKNRGAFLFITDVVLGKYYIPSYCQTNLPKGYHSFWAQSNKSGIMNDEMIIFNEEGRKIRYLLEIE